MGKEPDCQWQETEETWVQSLGWEDPLEEGMATQSSSLTWRISWTEEPGGYSPYGCIESDTTEVTECLCTHWSLCPGRIQLNFQQGFPCGSAGKESACNVRDLGSIPGLGRSPGEGKGYPLQYSGLENSTDCIVHGVAKSRTWLRDFHSLTPTSLSSSCPAEYLWTHGQQDWDALWISRSLEIESLRKLSTDQTSFSVLKCLRACT